MSKIPGGYILQPRKIDESGVMKEPPLVRELWLYLIRKVNWKNGKFPRGAGFFRFADIQNDLCWYVGFRKMKYSKPRLTKALRRLCEGNMTATMKATRGIVITVLNYDYYQNSNNYEGNDEDSMKKQRRSKGRFTIIKEGEEVKEEKETLQKKKPFVETSDEVRLSELLFSLMLQNNPKAKKPNIQAWAKHIDYMLRLDKRSVEEIKQVIHWSQQDHFWLVNILSTGKLREKFDKLWLKANSRPRPQTETEKKNKLFQAYLQDEAQNESASCRPQDVTDIENSPETANPYAGALPGERTDS